MGNSSLPCYPIVIFIPIGRQYADAAGVKSMARMLGDAVLPEQIQSRRRTLRNRLMDLREPVRSFREQNVPGPDVVGRLESRFTDVRDRFVTRTTVLERIRQRRQDDSGEQQQDQEAEGDRSGGVSSGDSRRELT